MAIIEAVKWDGEAWAAWGVLALGVVSSICAVSLHAVHVAYRMGYFKRGHEDLVEKVKDLEDRQEKTEEKVSELTIMRISMDELKLQVRNLRRDIIRLLRNKINVESLTRAEDEDEDN